MMFARFDQALACADYAEPEPVIQWRGLDSIAALDVDFHKSEPPSERDYEKLLLRFPLKPSYWWRTHGGGLRLVYSAIDPLSAHECAATARLLLRRELFRADAVEILPRTRHPGYERNGQRCGQVFRERAGGLDRAKRLLLGDFVQGDVDPDTRDIWLEENGMAMGHRYEHTCCTVDPSAHGNNQPVVVLDGGIHCHVCDKFTPFARLIDGAPSRVKNHLRAAVKNTTHWAHARHIIDDETAYRGLLKLWHLRGDDEARDELIEKQVGKVFFPAIPMVRCNDAWMTPDFSPIADKAVDGLIAQLPAVQYAAKMPKGGHKAALAPVTYNVFRADYDLADYGYPNIIPLRGVDVAEFARPVDEPRIFAHVPARPQFKYRRASERAEGRVTERLESAFPGVDVPLIKMLIACKGIQQLNAIDVPRIWMTGQSGSGKTTTILLAASICCDTATECIIKDNWDRFIRSFADASLCGSFAYINEADKTGLDKMELKSRLLDFDAGKTYHRLHVGTQKIKNPAVLCMTGTMLPSFLLEDEQIARRFAYVDLGAGRRGVSAASWKQTCDAPSAAEWRSGGVLNDNAAICDELVSTVMDDCFPGPGANPTFEDIVHRYGFKMMSEMTVNVEDDLKRLYESVKNDPPWTGGSRWSDTVDASASHALLSPCSAS